MGTENNSASSVWLSVVKAGVTAGLKGIITKTGTKVATSAICWGLDAVTGLSLGKGNQKLENELQTQLTDINGDLKEVSAALITIEGELSQIIKAIGIQTTKLESWMKSSNLDNLVTDITGAYNAVWYASGGPPPTTTTESTPPPRPAPTAFTAADVQQLSTTISKVVYNLAESQADNPGLMDLTVKQWLQQNNFSLDPTTLSQGAQVLEQTFLKYLTAIYQGYTAALNMILQLPPKGSRNPTTVDEWNAQQDAKIAQGQKYIDEVVTPDIEYLATQYYQCVLMLVLGPYKVPSGQTFNALPPQDSVNQVLGRATLLCWFTRTTQYGGGTTDSNPGLCATVFTRPSQMNGTGGLSQSPGSGLPASPGKAFKISVNGQTYWPVVFDLGAGPPYNTLAPYSQSRIVPVNYHWPLDPSSIKVGAPIGSAAPYSAAVPQYYSSDLQMVPAGSSPIATDVLFAYYSDYSQVEPVYYWSTWNWNFVFPSGGGSGSFNWTGNGSAPTPFVNLLMSFQNGILTNGEQMNFTVQLKNQISSNGGSIEPIPINAAVNYDIQYNCSASHGHSHAINSTFNASILDKSVGSWNNVGSNADPVSNNSSNQQLMQTYTPQSSTPDPMVFIGADITMNYTGVWVVVPDGGAVGQSATLTLNSVDLAWQQPKAAG